MGLPQTIQPRAGIDDARPLLFWDEPQTTFEQPMPQRPAMRFDAPMMDARTPPFVPAGSAGPSPATASPAVVPERQVRQRPQLVLGDILPQRTPVPEQPQYQQKDKYSFWDRVKAGLGAAGYNAGGGLAGMLGGFAGGMVHPDQIDEANYMTGPYAAWKRQVESARVNDQANLKDAFTRMQIAKMASEIEKSARPAGLKPLNDSPYLAFYDEETGQIVMPRVGGEPLPSERMKTGEREHDWRMAEIRERQKNELEELTKRQEWDLKQLGLKGRQAKEIEGVKQQHRLEVEKLKSRQQRDRDAYLEGGRNQRHKESMTRPTLTLPMAPSRRDDEEE